MKSSVEYVVGNEDIDGLGHMNFLRYVALFSEFRMQWLVEIGLSRETRRAANLGAVLLNMEIDYHKELRLGDTISVTTELKRKGNKSFTLYQTMQLEGQLSSETTVTMTFMNLLERKSILLPLEMMAIEIK